MRSARLAPPHGFLLLFGLLSAACGKTAETLPAADGGMVAPGADGAPGADAAPSLSDGAVVGNPDAAQPVLIDSGLPPPDGGMIVGTSTESYTVDFGPIMVPTDTERTQCITVQLPNPTTFKVGKIHNLLSQVSHHLIVYRVAAGTPLQATPIDCQPFRDTLDPSKGSPLMITQRKDETLALPDGVAYSFDANQIIRIEMHYINATLNAVVAQASTTFYGIPPADYQNEAGFLFVGDPDIRLDPMSLATLGPVYFPLPADYAGVQFFAITGHEHHLGTNVQVSVAPAAGGPYTPVYDVPNWLWSEPKTVFSDPPFTVPNGGGFQFTCDWNNTTMNTVRFGESANDEMCFFWAYYYPSKGPRVCFHTDQLGGSSDFCCPGSLGCQFFP
jgi:hypothetical protein